MAELSKIKRVMSKEIPDAPHDTFLIIDATTGQNGVIQAKAFAEVTNLTGVVITKMDMYVWELACEYIHNLQERGIYLPVSVNISRVHIGNTNLSDTGRNFLKLEAGCVFALLLFIFISESLVDFAKL